MSWEHFIWFAIAALICWSLGAFAAWKGKKPVWTYGFTLLGLVIFFSFIFGMWISLERPPMRTMGETRLWYSFFLPLAGLITYVRWKYKWILSFSCILSLVFICINIFKPEIHNKTLMPALQSPWFAPHVIVYMFAYAMLGAAVVMAVYLLWFKKKDIERKEMDLCDNLTYVGLAFMTLGMLTGALVSSFLIQVWDSIGAASLTLLDEVLFLQDRERLSDGLAADMVHLAERRFRRELENRILLVFLD